MWPFSYWMRATWIFLVLMLVSRVHLIRMFTNRAASTLKKRLRGWRTWWDFCRASSWNVASPTLPQLLDFFESLAVGVHEDRGRNRKAKAMGVVAAMKFTASRLQLGVQSSAGAMGLP